MPLRNPAYLDIDALIAHAQYYDVPVPQALEVVEKTAKGGGIAAGIGAGPVSASASKDKKVEYQATYSLEPSRLATVSKAIDGLLEHDAVAVDPTSSAGLGRDTLVELAGVLRLTAVSLAGKMFYVLKEAFGAGVDLPLDELAKLGKEELEEPFKRLYLRNEAVPIPMLLELTQSAMDCRVYVNLRPGHFVDEASEARVEGAFRVLGSVRRSVDGGDDGYLSAEEWLLHGWEYLVRRTLMATIDDTLLDLLDVTGLEFPDGDVRTSIAGPAVIIDAIAVY